MSRQSIAFADGPLYFPVTAFGADGEVDLARTTAVIESSLEHGPGGVFPACGTGEFHALSPVEAIAVARATVRVVDGAIPVLPGVGGPIGGAVAAVRELEASGADGVLLLPPYLVGASQEGLYRYVSAVAGASSLPVIIYHRGVAAYTAETVARLLADHDNIVGFKDGIGDVARIQEIVLRAGEVRPGVQFFNGLLTAEASQSAYRAAGVPLYSSAAFAMAPEVATAFYRAYRAADTARVERLLRGFYHPLVHLRDTTHGYAVSLIKAGLRLAGHEVGGVRAPLVDPSPEHLAELERILAAGRELVSAA